MPDKTKKDVKNQKPKRGIFKRIFLAVMILIAVFAVADICMTMVYSGKIPHRFASAEEGRKLLLANTDYYAGFTQNDIDFRMHKKGATMDELLKATTDEIKDFNFFEKYFINRHIAKMARTLSQNGYELPELEEIIYVKTDMTVEGGASGYTHGNEIYLNSVNIMLGFFPGGTGEYFNHLLWHELFHCLTRKHSDFRAEMYSLINFTVGDFDYELPPCIRDRFFSNPDVACHDSYATFIIDGEETDCFMVWISTMDSPEAQASLDDMTETVLVPIDGRDTYFTQEEATNFYEVFGTNNDYTVDPEECMANNFADAMQYGLKGKNGQGYPNPEMIQGVIDIVSSRGN